MAKQFCNDPPKYIITTHDSPTTALDSNINKYTANFAYTSISDYQSGDIVIPLAARNTEYEPDMAICASDLSKIHIVADRAHVYRVRILLIRQ